MHVNVEHIARKYKLWFSDKKLPEDAVTAKYSNKFRSKILFFAKSVSSKK